LLIKAGYDKILLHIKNIAEVRTVRDYLVSFFQDFCYETQDAQKLIKAYDLICKNDEAKAKWDSLIDTYNNNISCDYAALREGARQVGGMIKLHPYTMELLLYICFSKHTKEEYIKRGIDLKIYHDSMLDLRYKLEECKEVLGICGSFVASWFSRFFDLTRFALGRLQFELIEYDSYHARDGKVLIKGDKVINIHIPRTGTPMDEKSCDDSINQAYLFFKDEFTQDKDIAFVCHSWLLYPAHEQMLSESSNIRKFMKRFDIVDSKDHEDKHPDLWRLFDRNYTGNPDDLPYDSSLRRAYVDRLKAGGKTGWGYGVFFYM